jgi:hypothetical protein
MTFRLVSKSDAKTRDEAIAWLASETGGAVIAHGVVVEMDDCWKLQVFSHDGDSQIPTAAGRVLFSVRSWDKTTGRGVVTDKAGIEYQVSRESLYPECEGDLNPSEIVCASVSHQFNLSEVFPESRFQPRYRGAA